MAPKLLLSVALFGNCIATSASAEDKMPLERFVAGVRQTVDTQCEAAKLQMELSSSEKQKDAVRPALEINCNCFPEEFEKAIAPHGGASSTAQVSKEQAVGIAKVAYAACTARGIRVQAKSSCMQDEKVAAGVSDRSAYCACMAESLDKATNEELMDASLAAYANFEKKVQARRKGEPAPKVEPTILDEIANACREKHRK
jgi:hypothetical protein